MIQKKTILESLSRSRLMEIAQTWEVPGRGGKNRDELIDLIADERGIKPLELLDSLKVGELKELCAERVLSARGNKDELIDRLAGIKKKIAKKEIKKVSEKKEAPDFGEKLPTKKKQPKDTKNYDYPEDTSPMRPEIGTQASFKKKKPPVTYKYDSSLSPELQWDMGNEAREEGEKQLAVASDQLSLTREIMQKTGDWKQANENLKRAEDAVATLKNMSRSFLNWSGKSERGAFTVPTLPLFIHERLATKAIIETLKTHKRDKQIDLFDLFGDPHHSLRDQILRAYEYQDNWVNRMILGDSLTVMNSLLRYESLGGQVQMIYIDPPYGVKFGSNFQPFVRKRDVKNNEDQDLTREPEMVKAYRDTWELGLHSYLTYMRDRLLLARELLHPSGSIFVQISDENVHHLRELMDEVFGAENFRAQINFKSTSALGQEGLQQDYDYIIWYARDCGQMKFHPIFRDRNISTDREWRFIDDSAKKGSYRKLSEKEFSSLEDYSTVFRRSKLTSSGFTRSCTYTFELEGVTCHPFGGKSWITTKEGMEKLISKNRLFLLGNSPYYKQYYSDFPAVNFDNSWSDQPAAEARLYVVQTANKFIQRCMLMTTDPGDLVLDPTCGSGTSAYVAEQWGRRWITIDVSRVPLALARQRLLTATYSWFELRDEKRGPGSGFVYKRKQNAKGEEVGGIVPHLTPKSLANDIPPEEEVLVDRPEEIGSITRVTGPFAFEATIPTPVDFEGDGIEDSGVAGQHGDYIERMLEVLRLSPVLHVGGGKTIKLTKVRPPAKTLNLSAEALVENGAEKPVAIVFGPENGAVSEKLVFNAAKEASAKSYHHLYMIGFAIQPDARAYLEDCEALAGICATYVQATPDLLMGDLLKNMRSSQIFSVCGLPEIKVLKAKGKEDAGKLQVELVGLDVFDPTTMEAEHRRGDDVPAWFLDTNYNGSCFHVCQAFFPRTGAWESLKKALKAEYEESVWDHLAGSMSAPFEPGDTGQIAVKVIDDRGNELLVVKPISEAR